MKLLLRPANRLLWLSFLCGLFCLPSAQAQTQPRVTQIEIRHVGPAVTSEALVRSHMRVKEGEPYQRARVDDDVRNLYATGLFYNIRVTEEMSADGVQVAYVVQDNPTLTEIKFSGNKKYRDSRLLKKITSKTGKPLDEKKLFNDAQEIQKFYQKAGYQKAAVKPVPSIDEIAGQGTVTFEINEGAKVKIKDITFEGDTAFSERKLRKVLKTKRRWFLSFLTGSGVLKDEEFEQDKDRLVEFYQGEGYIDFQIQNITTNQISPTKMILTFDISEGRRYHVGSVVFKGNKLFSTNDILDGVVVAGRTVKPKMLEGDIFTPKGLTQDLDALRDFYGSKGYIPESGTRVTALRNANTSSGTMDLVFEITEGQKAFIERIDIRGNDKTKDKVVRRELAVHPGEVFDTTRVKLSQERLEGLNYFEKVDTRPEDTDIPNRKDLLVSVEEKNTGSFSMGAGFSSVDALVGFVEVSQANFDLFKPPTFTGAGQKFRLRAQIGTRRQDYQISFVEPWFLDRKLQFGVDLFHRDLNYVSKEDFYGETHTGGTLSLTRALGSDFLIGKISYTLEHVNLDIDDQFHTNTIRTATETNSPNISEDLFQERGSRLVSKVGSSIAFDTRNSGILPSRGQRSELIGELAGLGGNVNFYKLEGRSAWYFPGFFEGQIWEIVGRAGVVEDYGDGDRGAKRVPIFDRWFLGGLYSLRGYRYRDIGPKDAFGEPLGGETYYFGSVEYTIPIIERLRFALFYDIGNVFRDAYSFRRQPGQAAYSDNWGIGLRINLPIAPLRLDYGFPLHHDENVNDSGRFQFGVGYHREF